MYAGVQELSPEERALARVGKKDAKKRLAETTNQLVSSNVAQSLQTMLGTQAF